MRFEATLPFTRVPEFLLRISWSWRFQPSLRVMSCNAVLVFVLLIVIVTAHTLPLAVAVGLLIKNVFTAVLLVLLGVQATSHLNG